MGTNDATTIREFSDLHAWKKAHEVVLLTYKITTTFPKAELFGITNQMRRAALSVESNIAEGFGRNTTKDKQQFYAIAKGSLLELQSQSMTARDLGYCTSREYETLKSETVQAVRLVSGLIRSAPNR